MDRPLTRWLVACGVIAGPVFVLADVVLGATRADYDLLRRPGSFLSLGDQGWMQQVNYIVSGILVIAFAIGLRSALQRWGGSRSASVLIALLGITVVAEDRCPRHAHSDFGGLGRRLKFIRSLDAQVGRDPLRASRFPRKPAFPTVGHE